MDFIASHLLSSSFLCFLTFKKYRYGNSLVVQRLGLCVFTTGAGV